jgi:hypothetical protein
MMMLGHGFPIWSPILDERSEYAQEGVRIGDVAYIEGDGGFRFCFNIFEPRASPIHAHLQSEHRFQPIDTALDPSEVLRVDNIFKRGEVLLTGGVVVETKYDSLLVLFQ